MSPFFKFLRNRVNGRSYTEELKKAMQRKDSDQVEHIINAAFQNEETEKIVSLMGELCRADWHSRHEDVVDILQKHGDVRDISALEVVAGKNLPYLAFDENFGLARKATWAIADIGGDEAHQALERLAECGNSVIAAYAKKRLLQWDNERTRKRS